MADVEHPSQALITALGASRSGGVGPRIIEGAVRKPIGSELVARVVSSIGDMARGTGVFTGGWFSPGQPLQPVAPPGTEPRQFDFPVGVNLQFQPRATEGVSFSQLRQLADALPMLRIVLETRKDQVARMPWIIRPIQRPGEKAADVKSRREDPRIAELTDFFRYPDDNYEHPFRIWMRMLLEDIFVIDAPAILLRRGFDGKVGRLEILDGATIKPLVDLQGRRPEAPEPAYQQVIKGVVGDNLRALPGPRGTSNTVRAERADTMAADELLYIPRNPRSSRFYGYSPVEQILLTINTALRRAQMQLSFYTHGNMPMAFIQAPNNWGADNILKFQKAFDAVLEGNLDKRSKAIWIPGDAKNLQITFPREAPLKDTFDDYCTRVICYTLGVSPTQLIQQVNRSVAESTQEESQQEGLQPALEYTADLLNVPIRSWFGYNDLEFAWQPSQDIDPQVQSEVHKTYFSMGAVTINEIREELGKDPIPGGEVHGFLLPTGFQRLEDAIKPPELQPKELAAAPPGPDGAPAGPKVPGGGPKVPDPVAEKGNGWSDDDFAKLTRYVRKRFYADDRATNLETRVSRLEARTAPAEPVSGR